MDQRRALMAIGGIILILLAVVVGVAYYSARFTKKPGNNKPGATGSVTSGTQVPQVSPDTQSGTPPTGSSLPALGDGSTRAYSGEGWGLRYPANWGLLKCNNSQNIEFDPDNAVDQIGVACDFAVKPITVLVSSRPLTCQGDVVSLGNNSVVKSKIIKPDGDINYRWCVSGANSISLDITHRVSGNGSRATSKQDYSTNLEQILTTLMFGGGS